MTEEQAPKTPEDSKNPVCSKCNGRGWVTAVDFAKASSEKELCPKCHGQGTDGPRNGMYAHPLPGIMWDISWYEDEEDVSQLRMYRRQALDPKGEPVWEILELITMHTAPAFRRKGIMRGMIDRLINGESGKHIRYALTHWKDSTDDGRAFCKGFGMKKDGPLLVWENPKWQS